MDHLIVGLGNPGKKYETTRHNAGWLALDAAAEQWGVKIIRIRFRATCAEAVIEGKKVLLMKPQTFMNASGDAVAEACSYYNLSPEQVTVFCDDIALPVGRLRIRAKGSAGGHNGLKSIIERLGSDRFSRIRIGVSDRGDPSGDLADWVLGSFSGTDLKKISERFPDITRAAELILLGKTEEAMSRCNGDPRP